jgi:hypothetical protein
MDRGHGGQLVGADAERCVDGLAIARRRSTKPSPVSIRGGATGMNEMNRQIAVLTAIALRSTG